MSYLDQSLMAGEQVTYRTKLPKIGMVAPGILACFLGLAALGFMVSHHSAGWLFAGLALVIGGWPYLNYQQSEFGVTTKRVILKTGILRRRSTEILLSKIEAVEVDQDLLGRLLNYGTIVVRGTGGSRESFDRIDAPLEFRRAVHEQIEKSQR